MNGSNGHHPARNNTVHIGSLYEAHDAPKNKTPQSKSHGDINIDAINETIPSKTNPTRTQLSSLSLSGLCGKKFIVCKQYTKKKTRQHPQRWGCGEQFS